MLILVLILTFVSSSFAVKCYTNPCELGDNFLPPHYNCIELVPTSEDVICTCPNGQGRLNTPCRICDDFYCGPNGVCIERPLLPGSFHVCQCTNSTGTFINEGPCATSTSTISTTTIETICLNGGFYDPEKGICNCPDGFTGPRCEIPIEVELCRRITCANYGVCNPALTVNHTQTQCLCLNGFSGSNCELIGMTEQCRPNLCLNKGVCEERSVGVLSFTYCICPPGFDGQCCERQYFTCSQSGLFPDIVNCKFGRYIECVDDTAISRSCPPGSYFNTATKQCSMNGACPR